MYIYIYIDTYIHIYIYHICNIFMYTCILCRHESDLTMLLIETSAQSFREPPLARAGRAGRASSQVAGESTHPVTIGNPQMKRVV